ncbi:hypothetical protein [Kribbella sp. NPDC006257]|uniref:hypothetical protein n=1 Tax=Kribbella sp. NPDC006257 TaxID=3156738 RepID=UPI0033B93087
MLNNKSLRLASVIAAAVLSVAALITAPLSAQADDWDSRHWVEYNGGTTGVVNINWNFGATSVYGNLCVHDTIANGKGVYVQLNGNYQVSGRDYWVGAGNYYSEGCYNFNIPMPDHDGRIHDLNYVYVNMGNYWGSTVVWHNSDKMVNPYAGGSTPTYTLTDTAPIYPTTELCQEPWQNLTENCSPFVRQRGESVMVDAQRLGRTVGTNPYWVHVKFWPADGWMREGWMPSWYLNYAKNFVDGVVVYT